MHCYRLPLDVNSKGWSKCHPEHRSRTLDSHRIEGGEDAGMALSPGMKPLQCLLSGSSLWRLYNGSGFRHDSIKRRSIDQQVTCQPPKAPVEVITTFARH